MFTSLFVMSYRVTCCGRFVLRARFCIQHLKGLFQMPNSRYVACADGQSGVELVWPEGDRTQCLMDMSSINAESTQVECLTLYKLLVHLESVKKVASHKLSYTEVTRVTDSTSSSPDSFKVTLKDRMQYQCMADTTKSATMKNFFSQSVAAVSSSKCVRGVFRWRFERVHACLKIQKPYVLTSKALSLKAKEPVEIA